MNFENMPLAMRTRPQWTCFRSSLGDDGKHKKVIISPNTGKFAKCNDSSTWTDFDTATRYCKRYNFTGLTFALTQGVTFIDIDHAIQGDKILSEEAKQLMFLMSDTYIERSVSGSGIHIFALGSLPDKALNRNDKIGLEMYDGSRFACMTGNLLSGKNDLADYGETIQKINRDYIGVRPAPVLFVPNNALSFSDSELVEKIRRSRGEEKFNELFNGGFGNCTDHSGADFAFCSLLAWWTQDAGQIDRIFRSSGLYRLKWDERRGGSTYGAITIDRALQGLSSRYEPQERKSIRYTTPAEM